METKPATKAWQGREVEVVEVMVGVYLQSAVVCLDGITLDYLAHNPPPQPDLGTAAGQWSPSPLHTTPCLHSHQERGGVGSEKT